MEFELFSIDTVVHIVMYGMLIFLMLLGFEKKMNPFNIKLYLYLIVTCSLIGLIVELIQGNFIFRRFFSWDDAVANTFGTIVGAFGYYWTSRKLFNFRK